MPRINELKTCIVCGKPQPMHNFDTHNKTSDGLRKVCRHCAAKRRAQVKAARTRGTLVRPQKFAKPDLFKINPPPEPTPIQPPPLTQERVAYIKRMIDEAEGFYRGLLAMLIEDKYETGRKFIASFCMKGNDENFAVVELPPHPVIIMLMRLYNSAAFTLDQIGIDMEDWIKNHPPAGFEKYQDFIRTRPDPEPSSPDTYNDED